MKDLMAHPNRTVGVDLGDKYSYLCVLNTQHGELLEETKVRTTVEAFMRYFAGQTPMRIAIETGTHSPWVSRLLKTLGHEVLVANARKLRLIYAGGAKSDTLDARNLAKVARFDPALLSPIEHRSEQAQADLAIIRSRDVLVSTRTQLVNHVRGSVKAFGGRVVKCSPPSFHKQALPYLPEPLKAALMPIIEMLAMLNDQIKDVDKKIELLSQQRYPETFVLKQVNGVGVLTSLAFVLTLEEHTKFTRSRSVGAFLGLTPGLKQSGQRDIKQRISKQGDGRLRRLLVQSAQYILGAFGEDCDLRRHGEQIMARGGAYAKQRAVVAVARKLAVLLHRLWVGGEVYNPFFNTRQTAA